MRARALAGLAWGLALGCGAPDPAVVELDVAPDGCAADGCVVSARATGLLVESQRAGEPSPRLTLYAEARLPHDTTAVVEIAFAGPGGAPAQARYREIQGGRVRFTGRVFQLEAVAPSHDGVAPVAGRFRFVAEQGGLRRRVQGAILPATGEAVRLEPQTEGYVHTPTYVSCAGEIYVPPPDDPEGSVPLPDDPWVEDPPMDPDPSPSPMPDPGEPYGDDPGDPWTGPPPPPADSGCDGDDYGSDPAPAADTGCDGEDHGSDSAAPADSGCDDGGDYESSPADSGCDGDDYASSGSDGGCEGDGYEAATVLPIMGSMWRLGWPLGLAGLFNRRARRRRP